MSSHPLRRSSPVLVLALVLYATVAAPAARAASDGEGAALPDRPLIVATKEAPPFAMKDAAGSWQGLSIDLWEAMARGAEIDYELREMPLAEMLAAVESGDVDVAVAALTITPEREEAMDFSYPFLSAGLSIAFPASSGGGATRTLRAFLSAEFATAVGALLVVLAAAGVAVWLFERRANPQQFAGGVRGLGDGLWWSAVTMTTVGYGDKAPVSAGGRIVALIWMFTSIIIISSFTAAIASSVTVNQLGSELTRTRDLADLTLGTVVGSTGEEHARADGLDARAYPSLAEALEALAEGRVDAVMHDRPLLEHAARTRPEGADPIEVAPRVLVREDYAFAVPSGSALREPLNRAMLEMLQGPVWREISSRYLGADGA